MESPEEGHGTQSRQSVTFTCEENRGQPRIRADVSAFHFSLLIFIGEHGVDYVGA